MEKTLKHFLKIMFRFMKYQTNNCSKFADGEQQNELEPLPENTIIKILKKRGDENEQITIATTIV